MITAIFQSLIDGYLKSNELGKAIVLGQLGLLCILLVIAVKKGMQISHARRTNEKFINDFNATEEFKTLYIEDGKLKLRQTIVTTSEESAERELFFEFPIMVLVTIPYISDLIAGDDVMGKHVITPSETEKEVLDAIDYSMVRDFDGQHWGFRTIRGDFIRSGWWCDVCQYSEGLAAVSDSSGNYGYVGYNGILAINPKWKYAGPFSDGMAVVLGDNKLYGFIDRYGSESIPCQWKKAGPFKDGIAQVWDVKGNQYDIRKDGTIVES